MIAVLTLLLLLSLPTLRRWLRDKREHAARNRRFKYIRKLPARERIYAVWLEYFILVEGFDRSLPGRWVGPHQWASMRRHDKYERQWMVDPEHKNRSAAFARELQGVAIAIAGEDDPLLIDARWNREQGWPKPPVSVLAELSEMDIEDAKGKLHRMRRDPAVLLLHRLADWVKAPD